MIRESSFANARPPQMNLTPRDAMLLIGGTIAAAFVLGWLARSISVRGSMRVGIDALPQASKLSLGRAKYSETILNGNIFQLKCNCGEVSQFRGPNVLEPADLPVLPSTDTYTSPKCGFAMDLKRLREITRKLQS
jgi:hypothetical protein